MTLHPSWCDRHGAVLFSAPSCMKVDIVARQPHTQFNPI